MFVRGFRGSDDLWLAGRSSFSLLRTWSHLGLVRDDDDEDDDDDHRHHRADDDAAAADDDDDGDELNDEDDCDPR